MRKKAVLLNAVMQYESKNEEANLAYGKMKILGSLAPSLIVAFLMYVSPLN
jgi:hypothetical protein